LAKATTTTLLFHFATTTTKLCFLTLDRVYAHISSLAAPNLPRDVILSCLHSPQIFDTTFATQLAFPASNFPFSPTLSIFFKTFDPDFSAPGYPIATRTTYMRPGDRDEQFDTTCGEIRANFLGP
jgi:hypothetical protein